MLNQRVTRCVSFVLAEVLLAAQTRHRHLHMLDRDAGPGAHSAFILASRFEVR